MVVYWVNKYNHWAYNIIKKICKGEDMKMKKILSLILSVIMVTIIFVGGVLIYQAQTGWPYV